MSTHAHTRRSSLRACSRKPLLLAAALASLALIAGCAPNAMGDLGRVLADISAPKVTFLVPARSADAASVRKYGLAADGAELSQWVAVDLDASMNKLRVDERPWFERVKLGPRFNGVPPDTQLVTVGRGLGVDAMLLINGANTSTRRSDTTEERYGCSGDTKLFKSCPKERQTKRQVTCTQTEGLAALRMRVIRVADGRVLFSDTVTGKSSYRRCSDEDGVPQADTQGLVAAATSAARDAVMRTIAPTYEQRPLDMMTADAALPASNREAFDAALQFAKARRMDEACRRFDELYLDFKESVALTFNTGFCYETRGDLLKASQTYRRASELRNAPDSQIDRRLAQVEVAIRENPVAFMPTASRMATPATMQAATVAPSSGRRVALVIGNATYQRSALANPVNDARLVGAQLKRIGFDVTIAENATSARMATAIRDFANRAKGAELALLYYAGHAIQADGENILMPVDNGRMQTLEDVRNDGGLQLGEVSAMLDVANPRVKVVVLDACRDSPLPATTRGLASNGLVAVKRPPAGTLIAFATAPGRTAEDGTGRNSIFSRNFAAQLAVPGQSVETVFKRVREAVKAETRNRQEPTEVSSLVGDAYFAANAP
ncbi:caspase family protein [Variovorax sp. J22P271]|uniref:caspase family protein n=1 Tax=Variovorax davisae TaxID=3053515 RepID=UPI002574C691|nr:caspase family protein [Variovorax sp. J22P271]MDM0036712.1 caspase family protein [Variovorax sp. J22P271]